MKQKLIEMKGEIEKPTVIVGDFNISLSAINQAGIKSVKVHLTCTALAIKLISLTFTGYSIQQ